jgi:hypothetical protein
MYWIIMGIFLSVGIYFTVLGIIHVIAEAILYFIEPVQLDSLDRIADTMELLSFSDVRTLN